MGTWRDNSDPDRTFRVRKYGSSHPGPFIVIAETSSEKLEIAKLTKTVINEYGEDYIKAISMSRRKAKILMMSHGPRIN